jgi:hypothetical protein
VSDEVETPSSGELVIEGNYSAFGIGKYSYTKSGSTYCYCVTAIHNFGSMKKIPEYAFYQCAKISHLELPSHITSIGEYAFFGCAGLPSITILATTPPTVTDNSFPTGSEYENPIPIIVPKGCANAYKTAAGWSQYADYIVEAS